MEINLTYNSVALSTCFVLLLAYAWRVFNGIWLRPKRLERYLRKQGLRGNSYRLVVGDLKESALVKKEAISKPVSFSDNILPRILPLPYKTIQKYGKNSFTWIGPIPRVYVMDPELSKDVVNKFDDFQKNFKTSNPLVKLFISGVISYEGEKWAKIRGIMNPAFHLEKLKDMLPAFRASCGDMVSKWEKMVSPDGKLELDVWPHLETLTADVISRTAFGSSYGQGKNIFHLLKEQAELAIEAMESIYIPGYRYLPLKRNKRMVEIDAAIQSSVRGMINKRLDALKEGGSLGNDILSILLESNYKKNRHGDHAGMTIEEVVSECKLFYFAGQETTSGLLVWTMISLAKHPEWQEKAREEVKKVFGDNMPDYDGVSRLKIVTMIVNEVLRFYPPVVELTRIIPEETKLGDITLPAGVQLMLPIILLQQDEDVWGPDAKEFKPERFSEGILKATKNQFSYFPFGGGPRICIGNNFALLEVKVSLSIILQRFFFELSPSYIHAPYVVMTLQPQHGAHLTFHKLQK
ncbi:hypothetical protein RJ640_024558 [Escallonia rubra]|uniref:Cytochrome P450 n=1 Tax=Escallonia rubra TaxID=112253 RepID=A0AA88RK42_9ASTE|nr:hypothetical protein RJ640_024558 [Escallonia rubra]